MLSIRIQTSEMSNLSNPNYTGQMGSHRARPQGNGAATERQVPALRPYTPRGTGNLPLVRFNDDKCRFTLISMNNTMIKDVDGQLKKDKSSERKSSGVLPEEATHFSDTAEKICVDQVRRGTEKKERKFCAGESGKMMQAVDNFLKIISLIDR